MTRAHELGHRRYRPTESKYKGGAAEMYVTYDLEQRTRGGGHALYPKVKRVYIAGDLVDWRAGSDLRKRTGKQVKGVRLQYRQSCERYRRGPYDAKRGKTKCEASSAAVGETSQLFTQIVEVPERAENVHFYSSAETLPAKYKEALQNVR
jgi:hypothetical protein